MFVCDFRRKEQGLGDGWDWICGCRNRCGGGSAQLYGAFVRFYKMVARISHPRLDSPIFVLM